MEDFYELDDAVKLTYAQQQLDYWLQAREVVRIKMSALTNEEKTARQAELEAIPVPSLPEA
jgi:hypothetical protein